MKVTNLIAFFEAYLSFSTSKLHISQTFDYRNQYLESEVLLSTKKIREDMESQKRQTLQCNSQIYGKSFS